MNISTLNILLDRLLAPYAIASSILGSTAHNTYLALKSDRAIDTYRTAWILLQITAWLAFLACIYTLQAGRAARRFYEAEWAAEAAAIARRINRALDPVDGGVAFLDHALAKPLHWRIALDTAAALLNCPRNRPPVELSVSMAIGINPNPVQAVISGSGTSTNKLRSLASLVGIAWRHTSGKNKHMRNGEIRVALAPFIASDLLVQLS
jgi:hypothetical protein